MTPTEAARRSDALYMGTDNRRTLCDMIAHREADLDDASVLLGELRGLCCDMYLILAKDVGAASWASIKRRMRELGVVVDG